jgi:hypothetical protein
MSLSVLHNFAPTPAEQGPFDNRTHEDYVQLTPLLVLHNIAPTPEQGPYRELTRFLYGQSQRLV